MYFVQDETGKTGKHSQPWQKPYSVISRKDLDIVARTKTSKLEVAFTTIIAPATELSTIFEITSQTRLEKCSCW